MPNGKISQLASGIPAQGGDLLLITRIGSPNQSLSVSAASVAALGGGSFTNLATGTNTAATFTIGNGASLTFSGITSPVITQLATASAYAILGASAVTNSDGASTIISGGNIGSFPTNTITPGSPPWTLSGAAVITAVAQNQTDLATAIATYQAMGPGTALGVALDGLTLTPGVYSGGTFTISGGTLTLNGAGVYVFLASTTIGLTSASTIILAGGATAANVVFVCGSSFTAAANAGTVFNGNILAHTSITVDGGIYNGRLLANIGAVTISTATTIATPVGSSLGIINANEIFGVVVSGIAPTAGQVLTATSATTANWQTPSGGGGSGTVTSGTVGQIAIYAASGTTVSGFSNGVFYPETYGAVGNGIHDDTTAIQAAITAASASGGTVQFGVKTYLITATLVITSSNVGMAGLTAGTPVGGGASGTIITCNSATVDMVNVGNGGTQVHSNLLKDFCLARSVTPTTGNGLILNSVIDAKLENLWVFDSIFCFYHQNAQLCTYTNCLAEWTALSNGITGYGFKMVGTNTTGFFSTRMTDCIAINKASSGTFHGMHVSTSGAGVSDLFTEGFETASCTYGVYIDGASSNFNEDIHFLRTIHDASTVSAFYITGLNGHDAYVEINGGYTANLGSAPAIDIENSSGVVVNNVNFIGLNAGTGPCVLINGSSSKGNIVQSNVMYCSSTSQTVISLTGSAANNNVSSNIIVGAVHSFAVGIGLASSSYNTVDGNTLSGTGTVGISLDTGSGHNGGVNVVDPTSITTPLLDHGTGNFVTITGGGGSGTVTHTGSLTSNAIILGNGSADIKPGVVLPGSVTVYYDGTGNFSVPGGGGGSPGSLFAKTWFTTGLAGQRAINTVYQNTTGQPIIVFGWMVGNNNDLQAVTDASPTPSTVVLDQYAQSGFGTNFFFMVSNNDYYELICVGGTSVAWVELEIITGSVTFSGELSGSRSLSTVYQNTSGGAMLVLVDLSSVGGGTTIQGISDAGASPTNVVWQSDGVSTGSQTIWMMIPNNHYYEVTCSGASVGHWNEYSLPFNASKSIDYSIAPVLRSLQAIAGSAPSTTGVQIASVGKDMFVSVSSLPSTTGNLIINSSYCSPPGTTPYDTTTMSNTNSQRSAGALFVSLGEFYTARQNSGSPTLAHWWEYTLG